MSNTINLCKCPYCCTEFIYEDSDLVCEKCKPMVDVDLAAADMLKAVSTLHKADISALKLRKSVLRTIRSLLDETIEKAEQ